MRRAVLLSGLLLAATPAWRESPVLAAAGADLDTAALIVSANHLARPEPARIPRRSIAAFQDYLATLDPYSRYLTPQDVAARRAVGAAHRGVGALVTESPEGLLVVPLQGSPAAAAGISGPSLLLAVNGRTPPADVDDLRVLLDPLGEVDLTLRDLVTGQRATRRVPLRAFEIPPVETLTVSGRTIIRLHVFESGRTVPALRAALARAAAGSGAPVLDLRYASGGDLLEAIDSVSLLLDRAVPVAVTRDGTGRETPFRSRPGQSVVAPVVYILVGPQTASAAEVFVRALAHWRYGFTIGQTTYGKCVAQKTFPLPDGGGLVLTTARILDPAGTDCAGKGLTPDLPVAGNIHDTARVLRTLDTFLDDARVVCRAAPLPNRRAAPQAAPQAEDELGWKNGVGRMRPVALNGPGGTTQLCLMPPLPAAAAAALRREQAKTATSPLDLRHAPPAAPAAVPPPAITRPVPTRDAPKVPSKAAAAPPPARDDATDPAAPLRPTNRDD
ncbi:carboxyl-terminal processing protease [Azospirillum sp. OGB3]|uniref:S41 family peptidase n=1 Tax=Azospirillum sp. OGB3 TaxID=2587012 RepID=UPI001605F07F|nr:carboxyl-terminal processing protease [Azospirillum sp. OGB3]